MKRDNRLRRDRKRHQQKIDQNAARCVSRPNLSEKGIAEIKAEERMRGQLAEQGAPEFRSRASESGSPKTTRLAADVKTSGRDDGEGDGETDELAAADLNR